MRGNTKWMILGVIAMIWAVLTVLWACQFVVVPVGSTRSFETIKFVFLSISAFGVLFSSLLASFNSLESTANLHDRIEFDRIENSFDYILQWDSPSLKDARDWTRKIEAEKNRLSPDELCSRIEGTEPRHITDEQRNLQRSVITMFNYFEALELSIKANRVSEQYLRMAFAVPFQSIYNRFSPWVVRHLNQDQQDNLKSLSKRWA